MTCRPLPRRDFLTGVAATTAAALTPRLLPAGEPGRKGPVVRLGGPVFLNWVGRSA